MRTLAIGLDGCSWNVLEPLLATGELPHLSGLCENGACGVLESTIPFYTGPAWASFATGASPAAHGIYDFMMLREDGRLSVARQSDLRRITYYQQLGREGRCSVLINLPLDQEGCEGAVIVNSWLTDEEGRRILPVGRAERYRTLLQAYRTFPSATGDVTELCAIEQARFDLARELFLGEAWDHFFILFSSTDWLGHSLTGRFLAGDETAKAAMLRLYSQLDKHIGWFVEQASDAFVALVSDHGQCEEKAVVRVNSVLANIGLTRELRHSPDGPSPFFVDHRPAPRARIKLPAAIGRHRGNPYLRPLGLAAKRLLARRGVEITAATPKVDRVTSQAFSPTDASFAVYVRDCGPEELERARSALLEVQLRDGRPAIEGVWTPEELYGHSNPGAREPALLFAPALGVRPSAALKRPVVHFPPSPGRGCHQRDGILVLSGPDVAVKALEPVSICDLAPTLLWAMDAGIPLEGDGRVLFEAFSPAFIAAQPVREVDASSFANISFAPTLDSVEVTRRLRELGYI